MAEGFSKKRLKESILLINEYRQALIRANNEQQRDSDQMIIGPGVKSMKPVSVNTKSTLLLTGQPVKPERWHH